LARIRKLLHDVIRALLFQLAVWDLLESSLATVNVYTKNSGQCLESTIKALQVSASWSGETMSESDTSLGVWSAHRSTPGYYRQCSREISIIRPNERQETWRRNARLAEGHFW